MKKNKANIGVRFIGEGEATISYAISDGCRRAAQSYVVHVIFLLSALWMAVGVLVAELLVGETPDLKGILLFSASCIFWAVGKHLPLRRQLAAVALWSVLFVAVSHIFTAPAQGLVAKTPQYKQYQKAIENRISQIHVSDIWTDRERVTNQSPAYNDKEILTITADAKVSGNLYLKAFTGADYDNGSWTAVPAELAKACEAENLDSAQMEDLLWNEASHTFRSLKDFATPVHYTLSYNSHLRDDALVPYFSDLTDDQKLSVVGDTRIEKPAFLQTTEMQAQPESQMQDEQPENQMQSAPEESQIAEAAEPADSDSAGTDAAAVGEKSSGNNAALGAEMTDRDFFIYLIKKNLWVLLCVFVVCGIFVAVPTYRHRNVRSHQERIARDFHDKDYRHVVQLMNRRINRRLKKDTRFGVTWKTDLEYEKLLRQTYRQVDEVTWKSYMRVVKKAAYSNEQPTADEAILCYDVYKTVIYMGFRRSQVL